MSKIKDRFKKYIPTRQQLEESKLLKPLMPILNQSPDYWHFNQSSVSRACGIAVFGSFMPIPFQMIIVIVFALPLRANLIISLGLLWLNNPFTMVPIYWFCYRVGSALFEEKTQAMDMHLSWHWMTHEFISIWKPFILGCLTCGLIFGLITYFAVYFIWKYRAARNINSS